ncbi:MAG TPA: cystathionine beta-synthase [Candidatus Limnocylindria bacterium]|nr:cystathionine beta-synthase [Candidatus Limnocylindria bacterium]
MKAAPDVLALVGNTPLVRLSRIGRGLRPTIVAKMEHLNPGGSVKDRIGLRMIEDAERRGLLRPGATIVEPTSGNTGVGLAIAAAIKGYRLVCTMADKQSQEKRDLLRAFGAEVVVCPTAVPPESPESYYKVAERIAKETDGFMPNQYYNAMNPESHYRTTGPEIWDQTEGEITHLVVGVGTGGTVSGAGKFLKERNAKVQIVGADPEGSLYTGDIHPYKVEGIGEDFYPGTFDPALVDRWIRVSDRDSFLTARRLTREEGILVGGSSGTAMFAALEVAKELDASAVIVVLFADSGRSYLSKIYNDEWMRQNGYLARYPVHATVLDVVKDRAGTPGLIVVSKGQTVRSAIDTMQRYGISQIPVVADGEARTIGDIVGSVQEKTMLDRVFREPGLVEEKVERVMEAPFPVVQANEDVERLYAELSAGAPALLAAADERPVSIITKADLLEFVAHQRRAR